MQGVFILPYIHRLMFPFIRLVSVRLTTSRIAYRHVCLTTFLSLSFSDCHLAPSFRLELDTLYSDFAGLRAAPQRPPTASSCCPLSAIGVLPFVAARHVIVSILTSVCHAHRRLTPSDPYGTTSYSVASTFAWEYISLRKNPARPLPPKDL